MRQLSLFLLLSTCLSAALASVIADVQADYDAAKLNDPVPSAGCGKTATLKTGYATITSGSASRKYHLQLPANYDNKKPYRLIFGLHWLGGTYEDVVKGGTIQPYYGLVTRAKDSAIFIAPDGLDKGWANTGNRDSKLIDDLLALVTNDLCVDKSRIFSNGFSYGAGMSFSIACSKADVFRAVGLYSGAQLSGCDGGKTPIAFLGIHGLSDSVLNISQGRTLRDKFVTNNKCTAQTPKEPTKGSGGTSSHVCTTYEGCDPKYPVRWCAFDGDHTPALSWGPDEVWGFFSQF